MWVKLLPSALELFDRMLPMEVVDLPDTMNAEFERLCEAAV